MIAFRLNGQATTYDGDPAVSLLSYLRNDRHLTAAKDGCSGQAACGACLVELNGKACLACSTPMSKVTDGDVVTLEGLPETLRRAPSSSQPQQTSSTTPVNTRSPSSSAAKRTASASAPASPGSHRHSR